MAANDAVFKLPRGFGFSVSATSNAGARNFAVISTEVSGSPRVKRGELSAGESKTYRALFSDSIVVISGFAGNYVPSRLHPHFADGDIAVPGIVAFDDSLGDDYDYNDLIVTISRFKVLDIGSLELLSRIGYPMHSLDTLAFHHSLTECAQVLAKLDSGEPITTADYSSLPELITALNDEERALYNQDPIVGSRVLLEAREAVNATASLYEATSLHNGNGDAFRHFYWNFRMCRNGGIGESAAREWATAHESDLGNPALEQAMDLFNNNKGRDVAKTGVDDVPADLRANLRIGGCRIIRAGALVKSDNSQEI